MAAVLDPVMMKLSMKMIFVISAACCLLGSIHASSSGAAVTMATARDEVSLVKVGGENYEEILDTDGQKVRYGEPYNLLLPDLGFAYVRFFFGFGGTGVVARTDVQTTLNLASYTFVCQDNGFLELVQDPALSLKPMVRVRPNGDDTYRLQITDEASPVFVQFYGQRADENRCERGVEGSRVQFQLTPSSSSNGGRQAKPASEHATPVIPLIQLPTST